MFRSIPISVVALVAVLACAGDPHGVAITGPDDDGPGDPTIAELTGTVVVGSESAQSRVIQLMQADGTLIRLVGSEALRLASVAGGEVLVRGTWDASPGLVVDRFQVLSMNGRPALDGILEVSADGFGLRLVGGAYLELSAAPPEIADFVGARIWFTGSPDDPPMVFGVIAAQ